MRWFLCKINYIIKVRQSLTVARLALDPPPPLPLPPPPSPSSFQLASPIEHRSFSLLISSACLLFSYFCPQALVSPPPLSLPQVNQPDFLLFSNNTQSLHLPPPPPFHSARHKTYPSLPTHNRSTLIYLRQVIATDCYNSATHASTAPLPHSTSSARASSHLTALLFDAEGAFRVVARAVLSPLCHSLLAASS